jgi:hypothetical protein
MLDRFTILVTAVVIGAGCTAAMDDPVGNPVASPLLVPLIVDRPECPHDGLLSPIGGVSISPISLTAIFTSIPEFHDCQRFVVDVGSRLIYQSVYAIYAAPGLESKFNNGSRGAAATIVSDGGTYGPLGITPGVNCLYLEPTGTTWKALLVPNGLNGNCPVNPLRLIGFANYDVVVDPLPAGLTADDVPAVARWDWDAENRVQYIGIRCGDRWCEIGPRGFQPAPALAVPAGVNGRDRRVYLIKGWYDRQLLARPGSEPAVPSSRIGVLVPHFDLPSLAESTQLQPVGDQLMTGPVEAVRVYLDDDINLVGSLWVTNAAGSNGTYGWGGIVEALDGTRRLSSVVYRSHSGTNITIPATARWRWNPGSEDHSDALEHSSPFDVSDLQEDIAPGPVDREISTDIFFSPRATSTFGASRMLAESVSEGVWFGCAMGCCEEGELMAPAENDEAPASLFSGDYPAFARRATPFRNLYSKLPVQRAISRNAQ